MTLEHYYENQALPPYRHVSETGHPLSGPWSMQGPIFKLFSLFFEPFSYAFHRFSIEIHPTGPVWLDLWSKLGLYPSKHVMDLGQGSPTPINLMSKPVLSACWLIFMRFRSGSIWRSGCITFFVRCFLDSLSYCLNSMSCSLPYSAWLLQLGRLAHSCLASAV